MVFQDFDWEFQTLSSELQGGLVICELHCGWSDWTTIHLEELLVLVSLVLFLLGRSDCPEETSSVLFGRWGRAAASIFRSWGWHEGWEAQHPVYVSPLITSAAQLATVPHCPQVERPSVFVFREESSSFCQDWARRVA